MAGPKIPRSLARCLSRVGIAVLFLAGSPLPIGAQANQPSTPAEIVHRLRAAPTREAAQVLKEARGLLETGKRLVELLEVRLGERTEGLWALEDQMGRLKREFQLLSQSLSRVEGSERVLVLRALDLRVGWLARVTDQILIGREDHLERLEAPDRVLLLRFLEAAAEIPTEAPLSLAEVLGAHWIDGFGLSQVVRAKTLMAPPAFTTLETLLFDPQLSREDLEARVIHQMPRDEAGRDRLRPALEALRLALAGKESYPKELRDLSQGAPPRDATYPILQVLARKFSAGDSKPRASESSGPKLPSPSQARPTSVSDPAAPSGSEEPLWWANILFALAFVGVLTSMLKGREAPREDGVGAASLSGLKEGPVLAPTSRPQRPPSSESSSSTKRAVRAETAARNTPVRENSRVASSQFPPRMPSQSPPSIELDSSGMEEYPGWLKGALEGPLQGRYDFQEILGSGGMGTVVKAWDRKIQRPVAIKVPPPHLATSEKFRLRFLREAQALARLDYPGIVRIYDVPEVPAQDVPLLVMEFIEGRTLLDIYLDQEPLEPFQVLDWMEQASAALDHAHAQGVTHRDVKPANLMLEGEKVRLLDFGLALLEDRSRLTEEGALLGSVAFMPPEQIRGARVGQLADQYALAVTCFFLLSGELPFDPRDSLRTRAKSLREFRPELPLGVEAVFERAFAVAPHRRFDSTWSFVKKLRSAMEESSPSSRPLRRS